MYIWPQAGSPTSDVNRRCRPSTDRVGHERRNEIPNQPARIARLCDQRWQKRRAGAPTHGRAVVSPATFASRVVSAASLSVQRTIPTTSLRATGLSAAATLWAAMPTRSSSPTDSSRTTHNNSHTDNRRPIRSSSRTRHNRLTLDTAKAKCSRVMASRNPRCSL